MQHKNSVKQVIVVRKDLNMRKGKIAAQASHASMAFLTAQLRDRCSELLHGVDEHEAGFHATIFIPKPVLSLTLDREAMLWIENSFTKVVVSVNSEAELLAIYEQAKAAGLTVSLIQDSGRTEFHNVLTYTCVGIGPNYINRVDSITQDLPLL